MRRALLTIVSVLLLTLATVGTTSAHPERACSFTDQLDERILFSLIENVGDVPLECVLGEHPPDPV